MNWAIIGTILGIATVLGTAIAVLSSSRDTKSKELLRQDINDQDHRIQTLEERIETETKMRLDCQARLTKLEADGPSFQSLSKLIVAQNKRLDKLTSRITDAEK